MNENRAAVVTTVWIVVVSIFLYSVIASLFQDEGTPKYIKNNENGIVIKSETKNKVKYKIEDGNGKHLYSWTFAKDNSDLTNDDVAIEDTIDLNIETDVVSPKIEKLVNTEDKLIVTFHHHGGLPSSTDIELNVSDKYSDGENLYLYYYNEEENVIEYISNNIIVSNGIADFTIEHCSEYILSTTKIEGSINNPSGAKSYLFYGMVLTIIFFALKAILFKGK